MAIVALVALAARVDAEEAKRGSGYVPTPRKTREELVREWDLNSDGTIDQGEAEVAASRMRLERAELRLNSGIDPITGLPRDMAAFALEPTDPDAAAEPTEAEATEAEPAEDGAARRREWKPLPGTRVPQPTLPGQPAAAAPPEDKPGSGIAGTRADADRKRQPMTGGVRAGGLAARPGYGSGVPAAPLNAGLPIGPKPRPPVPSSAAPAARPRGGLVPAPRAAVPAPPSRDLYDPY